MRLNKQNLIVNHTQLQLRLAYLRYSGSNLVVEHDTLPKFVKTVHCGFGSCETARTCKGRA